MGIGNQDQTAFAFNGNLKDFMPIAWRNSLLTFATLGLYRSWAINRERQYLWANTRFIDENIEWTGSGKELFRGFVIGMIIFAGFAGISYYLRHFVINEDRFINYVAGFILYCIFFWLTSLAGFRGLRYRLSRTHWRGIRGGSNDGGYGYAAGSVGRYILCLIVGIVATIIFSLFTAALGPTGRSIGAGLALLVMLACVPIVMMRLFADKWKRMSFGPHGFYADPKHNQTMFRLIMLDGAAIVSIVIAVLFFVNRGAVTDIDQMPHFVGLAVSAYVAILFFFGLLWISYKAVFNRESASGLEISTIDFAFTARTKDWLVFTLGQLALSLIAILFAGLLTLPLIKYTSVFGDVASNPQAFAETRSLIILFILYSIPMAFLSPFVRYRRWRFFVRHVEAGGEIDVQKLTQSETKANKDSEGLLDAFDFGAI